MGTKDRLATFFCGQAFVNGFRSPGFHRWLQSNTFNRADLRKAGAANNEARFAVFSG
jgi:hypothetical protein